MRIESTLTITVQGEAERRLLVELISRAAQGGGMPGYDAQQFAQKLLAEVKQDVR